MARERLTARRRDHAGSWNWKLLLLHSLMSPSSMVRSTKVTAPAVSIRTTVFVLGEREREREREKQRGTENNINC